MTIRDFDRKAREVARDHAAADQRCGRGWVCACAYCQRARVLNGTPRLTSREVVRG